jgi:nicotinate-nucleotide adenylyltransferase
MTSPAEPSAADAGPGLGILGGAFNPPHTSHVRLATQALAKLPIAELRVIPSGDHPHKRQHEMAPAHHRLAMCKAAFAGIANVVVDDRELRRAGPSFTVDTMAELRAEQPRRPLFLLIGSDNLPLLPTWHDPHRLLALCTVVTYPRAGHPIDAAQLAALPLTAAERRDLLANVLDLPADTVTATQLRHALRRGATDLPELAPAVASYIQTHALYR